MISSIIYDIFKAIYPSSIFSVIFSYFIMCFYLLSEYQSVSGQGWKCTVRLWIKIFYKNKSFRRTYYFVFMSTLIDLPYSN